MFHFELKSRNLISWQAPPLICSILKMKGHSREGSEGNCDCSREREREEKQKMMLEKGLAMDC